jgi:hypothetical protein
LSARLGEREQQGGRGEREAGSDGHPSCSDLGSPPFVLRPAGAAPKEERRKRRERKVRRGGMEDWWLGKQHPSSRRCGQPCLARRPGACEEAGPSPGRAFATEVWQRRRQAGSRHSLLRFGMIERQNSGPRGKSLSASFIACACAEGMSRQRQGEREGRMGVTAPERRKGREGIHRR